MVCETAVEWSLSTLCMCLIMCLISIGVVDCDMGFVSFLQLGQREVFITKQLMLLGLP